MRLDKWIATVLNVSRSDAKKYVRSKKVKVNNVITTDIDLDIKEEDKITYLDEVQSLTKDIYLMMNKPKDYICAKEDGLHKTVMELLEEKLKRTNLSIVGRLDKDTTGLLLITSDGALNHRLTSPKASVPKKYYVEIDSDYEAQDVERFLEGVLIIDKEKEEYKTKPAKLECISSRSAYLTIGEGKFHQVKKMHQALNKKVLELKRVMIGPLFLDGTLKEGECRLLTEEEIKVLKSL